MKSGLYLQQRLAPFIVLFGFAAKASAHPGHEHPVVPPSSPLHMVMEPQHLLQLLGIAALAPLCFMLGGLLRRTWERRKLVRISRKS